MKKRTRTIIQILIVLGYFISAYILVSDFGDNKIESQITKCYDSKNNEIVGIECMQQSHSVFSLFPPLFALAILWTAIFGGFSLLSLNLK